MANPKLAVLGEMCATMREAAPCAWAGTRGVMPSLIVDLWSFWRMDMREKARAISESEAWNHLANHPSDSHYLDPIPMLNLDWDGKDEPNGGAVARIMADDFFPIRKRPAKR